MFGKKKHTDKERLDLLEKLHKERGASPWNKVILRYSVTGRGWRLHSDSTGANSVREAIDAFIEGAK